MNYVMSDFVNGPFGLVMIDPDGENLSILIAPKGGFITQADAIAYVAQFSEETPKVKFLIVPLWDTAQFNRFMSF